LPAATGALQAMPGASRALGRAGLLVLLLLMAGCGGTGGGYHTRGGYSAGGHGYAGPGPPDDPWGPYIHAAAARFGVPERWIREVMRQESGGQQYLRGQLTTSSAGAMGLMQVMPGTYEGLRQRYGLGPDPYDPRDNIMAGAGYIREMYDRYGSPGFLAAYNAGPNRVDDYMAGASSLPNETVNYVASIAPRLGNGSPMSGPLAVYAEAASPMIAAEPPPTAPASTPLPAYLPEPLPPSVQLASVSAGACDPNAAYDPEAPCAALPSPVPIGAVAAVPAYQPDPGERANVERAPLVAPPPQLPAPAPAAVRFQLAVATVPAVPPTASGRWSIQVGAFKDAEHARAVAEAARVSARDLLGGAHIELPRTTPFGGVVLYRARLTGLAPTAAALACARLGGQRVACAVVSPDQAW